MKLSVSTSLLIVALSAANSFAAESGPALVRRHSLSSSATQKVDPRILMALSQPVRTPQELRGVGKMLPIHGADGANLEFSVLIETELTDAELAALGADPSTRVGNIVAARVRERDLERLASDPHIGAIEGSYWMQPYLDLSIPETRANLVNTGPSAFTGQGVLYGLLDDGIDVTHADFRNAQGGSRVLFVWDHSGQGGTAPAGFNYGREYTKAQIEAGQATQFVNDGGHGSHVAGISVGDGSSSNPPGKYRGIAYDAEIIHVRNGGCDLFCYGGGPPFLQNPTTVGSLDALNYLLQKKQQLGRPMVVNQSQGTTMGPHDGSTLFEQAYQQFITNNGLIIAIAAGNDQEANWHGRNTVAAGGQVEFTLTHTINAPEQALPTLVWDLWYPAGRSFRFQLVSPRGTVVDIPSDTGGQNPGALTAASRADTVFFYTDTSHPSNQQGYCNIFLQNRTLAPETGTWRMRVISESGSSGQVDLYCERNQFPLAVQNASREAILGMPGTVTGGICVASYATKNSWTAGNGQNVNLPITVGEISSFSSNGPRRDGAQKPDIAAPGEWIFSAFAAGSSAQAAQVDADGEHYAQQGTSMACPHVAGAIALMLQRNPALTPAQVKQILQDTARHDGFTGQGWNREFGFGKLDVQAAVNAAGGGTGGCATSAGDANADNTVNVLDAVATVNDILGSVPLGAGRECADVDNNSQINVLDVVSIVNIILGFGPSVLADETADAPSAATVTAPISWGEDFSSDCYRLVLDAKNLAGVQLSFIAPRGFELVGEPRLLDAAQGATIASHTSLGQTTCVIHASSARLAGASGRLVVEMPLRQTWNGGQSIEDFTVTRLVLADRNGREATLAEEASLTPSPASDGDGPVGLGAWLASTSPNPTHGATRIDYSSPQSGVLSVVLHDASGRRVRELWNGWQMAGPHILHWDGRDDSGREVSAGAYFVQIAPVGGRADSQKILVVK